MLCPSLETPRLVPRAFPPKSLMAVAMSATRRRSFRYIPDDDGTPASRRALAEASLGTLVSTDQMMRSIMFRFRVPHIPQLVELDGRVHFQLRSNTEISDTEGNSFDYFAHVGNVTEKLNSWLVGGTMCEAIMNAAESPPTCVEDGLVLDVRLEVRTSGIVSEEWNVE